MKKQSNPTIKVERVTKSTSKKNKLKGYPPFSLKNNILLPPPVEYGGRIITFWDENIIE